MPQQLKDHSLRQLDDEYLADLEPGALLHLSKKLLHDLKQARERLNQDSNNSSQPPGSRAPWQEADAHESEQSGSPEPVSAQQQPPSNAGAGKEKVPESTGAPAQGQAQAAPGKRKPGKQPGAPGYGRSWHPPIDQHQEHYPSHCDGCGRCLDEQAPHRAYTGYDSVDIQWGNPQQPGLVVTVTGHRLYESVCPCGLSTRFVPHVAEANPLYPDTPLGQWRLIGPTLASFIVHLRLRWRLSIRRSQELLAQVLGIELSVGALQQCFEQAAAGAAPLEDALVEQLLEEAGAAPGVLWVDETSWKERGKPLWLWTFVSTLTVCFWVGRRTRELFENVIGATFQGWIMSDGYRVYRHYPKRLRCWAHLIRKARGLAQSLVRQTAAFGRQLLELFEALQEAIYTWREHNPDTPQHTEQIERRFQEELAQLRQRCQSQSSSGHEKSAALAKELLNDWEAIFRILRHPHLPLTNNEAERALRHWVILRRISHGTKSETGSRSFALLASLIDTCRRRGHCALDYIAQVIGAARCGLPLPALPQKVGG